VVFASFDFHLFSPLACGVLSLLTNVWDDVSLLFVIFNEMFGNHVQHDPR